MKRDLISADPDALDAPSRQYGAICWRKAEAKRQVLLISSRETGRWIVPKGWPIKGLSAAAVAEREAWEEAGVRGKLCEACFGVFTYQKVLAEHRSILCSVAVYGLRVDKVSRRYPESHQRKRKWFALREAAELVEEPGLTALLLAFDQDACDAGKGAASSPALPQDASAEGNS